ncbi:MAG: High-affinity nickel-transporter, partial [Actinomycetota bacterium]|nr:High-affinity nickel-transporter [Actinomycetota bacterium]
MTLFPVSPASAHPLGDFVINHYNGLHLTPDSVENYAVIDSAELPTLTQKNIVDADGDESISSEERAAFASAECAVVASEQELTVAGDRVSWQVNSAEFSYSPGAGGLQISRLDCRFASEVDLSVPASVTFVDSYLSDRVGWREITATSDGVALDNPAVPAESRSDELRVYPEALLSSPLDQRSVELSTSPGAGISAGDAVAVEEVGGLTRVLTQATDKLSSLAVDRDLTFGVGSLAVLLALVLGASHAALPGHGKTIMAAYMVGTRGTPRDAVLI